MTTFELNNTLELPSFKQQDVPEVFQLLLNKLDSDSTEGPHFKEVFKATLVNLTECTKCDTKDGIKSGSGIVILPLAVLPKKKTDEHWSVAKALEQFLHEDNMTGENQIYCSTCRMKTDTKLRQTFTSLPQILVVQLKRFDYNFSINQFVKLDSTISINMNLELPCETATQLEKKVYDLFAICDHHGGLYGGHYTALIKPKDSDTWHSFNDSIVKTENLQQKIENMMPCNDDSILLLSDTAYLLMYRETSDGAPKKDQSPAHDESTKPLEQKGEGDGDPLARHTGRDEHRALLHKERADSRIAISSSSSKPSLCQKNKDPRRSNRSDTENAEWDKSHKEPEAIVTRVPRIISQYPSRNTDINLPENTEHNMTCELQYCIDSCLSIFQSPQSCVPSCCRSSTET